MTERRLPPALEENLYFPVSLDLDMFIADLLDWLYGEPLAWRDADGAERHATTSGLVERVEERVNRVYPEALRMGYEVMEALRAELGKEAAWSEPLHLKNVNSSEAPMSPE